MTPETPLGSREDMGPRPIGSPARSLGVTLSSQRCMASLLVCMAALVSVTMVGCGDGSSSGPVTDSNSNWLSVCLSDNDCESPAACVCGVCTVPCSVLECGLFQEGAVCIDEGTLAFTSLCREAAQPPPGLCLPECSEEDDTCGTGMQCTDGACIPVATASVDPEVPTPDNPTPELPGVPSLTPEVDTAERPTTRPNDPTTCEEGCAERALIVFRECITLGGDETSCELRQTMTERSCLADFCDPETTERPLPEPETPIESECAEACAERARRTEQACLDEGNSIRYCAQQAQTTEISCLERACAP